MKSSPYMLITLSLCIMFNAYGEVGNSCYSSKSEKKLRDSEPVPIEACSENTKTASVKYISAEFIGHCRVVFKSENGEQLVFINPDLGSMKSDKSCGINWDLHDSNFLLTYRQGKISFYTEDVGDQTTTGNILISIKQQ